MFGNLIAKIEYKNEIHKSLHDFKHIVTDKDPGHWILFGIVIFYFLACFIKDVYNMLTCGCWKKEVHKGGFEHLLDFPRCLNSTQLDNFIKEEEIIWNKFGYKKMFDDTF